MRSVGIKVLNSKLSELIYVDTSVALAHLFAEDRRPPASFWTETLVSSRLLDYEIWTRLHARRATDRRT